MPVPKSLVGIGRTVVVHEDITNFPAVKAFAAERGFDVVKSNRIPPGNFYVYDPHKENGMLTRGDCLKCDYLDVPCQEHTTKSPPHPQAYIRPRTPGALRLWKSVRSIFRK